MEVLEVVVALLLGGAALALIPGVPTLVLDPELDWAELGWAQALPPERRTGA